MDDHRKSLKIDRISAVLAILLIIWVWVLGFMRAENSVLASLETIIPEAERFVSLNVNSYAALVVEIRRFY